MATKKKKRKAQTSRRGKPAKSSAKKKSVAKKKPVAKKKRPGSSRKKTSAKKRATSKKKAVRKPSVKKKASAAKKTSVKKKSAAKKRTVRRVKRVVAARARGVIPSTRIAVPRTSAFPSPTLGALNYRTLENEISKLTDLLQTIRKKNVLVKKSLAYLEKEQKRVSKQIQDARKYLTQLKNRGIKALREFPDSAEEIFSQLKTEITRLSRRLGILSGS